MLDKGVQEGPGTEEWKLREVPVPGNCDSAGSRCQGQSPVSGQIPVAQVGRRESARGIAGGRERGHFLGIPLDPSWDPAREPSGALGPPCRKRRECKTGGAAEIVGVWAMSKGQGSRTGRSGKGHGTGVAEIMGVGMGDPECPCAQQTDVHGPTVLRKVGYGCWKGRNGVLRGPWVQEKGSLWVGRGRMAGKGGAEGYCCKIRGFTGVLELGMEVQGVPHAREWKIWTHGLKRYPVASNGGQVDPLLRNGVDRGIPGWKLEFQRSPEVQEQWIRGFPMPGNASSGKFLGI